MLRILAIIPAHNEEHSLPRLIGELHQAGVDTVVVDDASSDATERVARAAGALVLHLSVNLGIGGAVQAGFLYAVRNGYDVALQVDGDGQHDPAQIPLIVAPLTRGEADCVIGSRYLPACPDPGYKTPFLRRVGMHFSMLVLLLATGLRIHDTTSGFRALNRDAFTFFSTEYPVDHPEAESLLVLHQAGFRFIEVPVTMRIRTSGESLFSFIRAALYPMRVIVGFIGIVFKTAKRT